jgi:hypothetical protein
MLLGPSWELTVAKRLAVLFLIPGQVCSFGIVSGLWDLK